MRNRNPLHALLALLAALALSLGGIAACEDPRDEVAEEETDRIEIDNDESVFEEENEFGEEGGLMENEGLENRDPLLDPEYGEEEPVEMIEE